MANSGDVECLGVFYGLIGKISFQVESEARLLLIKETDVVGELPDGRTVIKIRSIAFLYPCGPDVSASEIGLKSCKKHRAGGYNMFEVSQKAPFAKTWGTMKSAANSLKSTTQQAAALASYQVNMFMNYVKIKVMLLILYMSNYYLKISNIFQIFKRYSNWIES